MTNYQYAVQWRATDLGRLHKIKGDRTLGGAGYYVERWDTSTQTSRLVSGPWSDIDRAEAIARKMRAANNGGAA